MAYEQYVDLLSTTLATGINNSTTTVVLSSATGFPATGNYTILLEEGSNKELMHVTSRSGTSQTVATRGSWGTSAFSFTTAATIKLVLSALAFDAMRSEMSRFGTYANLPSDGKLGDRYKCTDVKYDYRHNGSLWVPWYDGEPATLPPSSSWTWENQGSSTVSFALGVMQVKFSGSGGGNRNYYRTIPSTPYTITVRAEVYPGDYTTTQGTMNAWGVFWRDASGKMVAFHKFHEVSNGGIYITKWSSNTTVSAAYINGLNSVIQNSVVFHSYLPKRDFRITDNGTNFIFQHRLDGLTWITIHTVSRTDYLATGPTDVGICAFVNTTEGGYVNIYDWTVS